MYNFMRAFKYLLFVFVSLTQLLGTIHKICKVQDSNSDHYQKIFIIWSFDQPSISLMLC